MMNHFSEVLYLVINVFLVDFPVFESHFNELFHNKVCSVTTGVKLFSPYRKMLITSKQRANL